MRTTTWTADQTTIASARRDGWALSDRKGTWLTQMKALATPPTKEKASKATDAVDRQSPSCDTASSRPEAIRKGRRPRRSLSMPVGRASRAVASGAMAATWPMKSS